MGASRKLIDYLSYLLLLFYNEKDRNESDNLLQNTQLISITSQVALAVKNLPASAADLRDTDSIPGSGRSPGRGHGNPLQCSCLENPMDRGTWQAIVHRVAKSQTQLKPLSMYADYSSKFTL